MKNSEYWKQRFVQLENAQNRRGAAAVNEIEKQYKEAQKQLEGQIAMWYQRFADNNGITLAQARKSGYYHTAYELQKGFNIGWDIAGLDQSQIEKVLAKPWAVDGKNFSERIWNNKNKLISEVHDELTQNIMLGADPQKAIDSLAKKMNASKENAGKLIMTEEAYFSSLAQKDCFNDLDVEKFEIVATLDSHTSEICRDLDGKVFEMKDFEPGTTAPPFHPFCRSTTVPYFDDDFGEVGERAARDEETGKTYYVPADMNYRQWKKTFVDGGDKSGLEKVVKNDIIRYTRNTSSAVIRAKDTSDFDVLSNYLDSTYGIKMDDSVKLLDFLTVRSSIEGVESVISEYPDVGISLEKAITSNSGVMSCTGKTLSFNPNYFMDRQKFLDICKQQSAFNHWIPNSSPESLGVHEAAHGVEWILIEANTSYIHDFQKITAWNDCTEAKLIVSQACKNIKKTAYGKGKRKLQLIQSISKYATASDSETMAEAFADVYANGVNANPLSVEIKRLTKEALNKYKGVI